MILYDAVKYEQGSEDWFKLRLGLPTASEFADILTDGGKLSSKAFKYACRLANEHFLRMPAQDLTGLQHIEHGKDMEPRAIQLYEFSLGVKTKKIGFITTDDGQMGASPDRLVDEDGCLEIKCPSGAIHIQYMAEGPGDKYRAQVQGQLLVTDRSWADFLSYHPCYPRVLIRTKRDEAYIAMMRRALKEFLQIKKEIIAKVEAAGYVHKAEKFTSVTDKELNQRGGPREFDEIVP